MTKTKTIRHGAALCGFALILAACGPGTLPSDTSSQRSTDPALTTLMNAFTQACLENAPEFEENAVKADFQNAPATNLLTLLSAKQGQSCRVFVRGYGTSRARPTSGDLIAMAGVLQSRVGGTISQPNGANIKLRGGSANYNISGYVTGDGNLTFNVYK